MRNNLTEPEPKVSLQLRRRRRHRLTFMTSAIFFHSSWVGSVPVGLCAQAWRMKMECSGAFCGEQLSQVLEHNHATLVAPRHLHKHH